MKKLIEGFQLGLGVAIVMGCVSVSGGTGHAQVMTESASDFWVNEQRRRADHAPAYRDRSSFGFRGFYRDPGRYRRSYQDDRFFGWNDRGFRGRDIYRPEPSFGRRSPTATVDSPQYFTYSPDSPAVTHFAKLCELEVASHADASTSSLGGPFAAACASAPAIKLRVLPDVATAIKTYYAQRPHLLWVDEAGPTARARAAIAELANSDRLGLNPGDYHVTPLASENSASAPSKDVLRFEIDLSAKVLAYVLDATRGRIDPNRISGYHDLPRKTVDLIGALSELSQSQDVTLYLEQRNPINPQFRALMKELQDLRSRAPRETVTIAEGTFIRPGDADPELANVVAAIRLTGSEELKKRHAEVLANEVGLQTYGDNLVALVRDFQRENGLKSDGIVGEDTIRAMTRDSTADKIKKVRLAMERLRWLPRELGDRHVFINQPAFEVTYLNGGNAPLSMRAVIGKTSNQTYFFTDRIEAIEYNPYWGVPRSIVINEMLPKLYRDPSYLDRLGYEVRSGSGPVSSRYVDWEGVANKRVSVDVRQPPGPGNALGRIKIKFPNKHAIYMHDTPKKALFSREVRALSHGCVRLQHPRAMAAALLGKTVEHVDSRIAAGRNAVEPVTAELPVYVAYFTAWPDAGGTVHYYDDIYDRDAYLSRAVSATHETRKVAVK